MADTDEQERKARLWIQALGQWTTTANANHPVPTDKRLMNESERVHKIVVSNLAAKDD